MRRPLAFILCFGWMQCLAQLPRDIRFTDYTSANGFPEENVNSVIQDSRGFLWVGSREGLIRFDGLNHKTWHADPNDSSKFFNNNISVAGEYKKGYVLFLSGNELWQVNIYNQQILPVTRFKGKKLVSAPKKISSSHWFIADSDSAYITGPDLNVFYTLDKKNFYTPGVQLSCFPLHYPYALIYGGSTNKMFLLNYETRQTSAFHFDDTLLDERTRFFTLQAYDSSRRRLYLSAYFNGNFYCDLQVPEVTRYHTTPIPAQKDGAIRRSLFLPDGLLMQGGDNDLYITDLRSSISLKKNPGADNLFSDKIVVDLYKGQGDHYWISTNKGITHLSLATPDIAYLQKDLGFSSDDEFKSILKGSDGNIWFLMQLRSLYKFDKKDNRVSHADSSLIYCWAAVNHRDEILATGGGSRLISYNPRSGKTTRPGFLQPFYNTNTDLVTLVFKARNGDLWYSCNGSAGFIRNPAGTREYIQYSKTKPDRYVSLNYAHTAAEDSHGNIWFATNKSQVMAMWNATTRQFEEYETGRLLPQYPYNTGVNNLFIDADDNLWVALDGAALIKYNVNSRKGGYYDINRGLPSNAVYSMTSDGKKRIWFGTRKGLCCYLPATDKIVTFTEYDGLPEVTLDGRGIFYDSSDNLLYTGGRRSLAWFDPDRLLQKSIAAKPQVYIDQMKVNGKEFYFQDETNIGLRTTENNIEFSFSVPDFSRNSQLAFEYRLKGAGKEWTDIGNKRSVTFTGLPHGKYTFSVRCRYTGSESWSETGTPFTFIIKTPWNKSWWFISAVAILLLLFSWYVIRLYYRRKMEKQQVIMEKEIAIEQERTKMARELHDGLGSMLSGIKHSFAAMNKEFSLTEKQQTLFHANLDKLNESIIELRNISHNMASDALLKYGIENSLRDYCNNTSTASGISIIYNTLNTEKLKLGEERSFHVFRVMQELLQNIIKHSAATRVLVQLSCNNNLLYIAVEDDGKGFDIEEAKKQKSMGLKNIESRIKLLKGNLDYQTSPGKGTSVLISIPLD